MFFENTTMVWLAAVFCFGYLVVVLEHFLHINKAVIALLTGTILWFILGASGEYEFANSLEHLDKRVLEAAGFLFFLWGAMMIVEIINAHHGFNFVLSLLPKRSKRAFLIAIGFFSFFLAAILDNLATTIVMLSIAKKVCHDPEERKYVGVAIVIAANAGGTWSPIGSVTTTMLWIGGQLTPGPLFQTIFVPSLFSVIASFLLLGVSFSGRLSSSGQIKVPETDWKSGFVGICGFLSLIFVPILKMLTSFPPYVCMLFSMSVMALISEIFTRKFDAKKVTFYDVCERVETTTIFFFLGILLAIGALEGSGLLHQVAVHLSKALPKMELIPLSIGIVSAVVDNIPLVAASMEMYTLSQFPQNHHFWLLLAYAASVGGSMLIIGSAAGVAFMGIERVHFIWYCKKATIPAAVGFFVGFGTYLLFN